MAHGHEESCYTSDMNNNENLKASSSLVLGDLFTYRGERACFLHYTGYARSTRYGVYRMAWVQTPDGQNVKWSLNQAGSVKTF